MFCQHYGIGHTVMFMTQDSRIDKGIVVYESFCALSSHINKLYLVLV